MIFFCRGWLKRLFFLFVGCGLAWVSASGCLHKKIQIVGSRHDSDWPIEDPKTSLYNALLHWRRFSDQGKVDKAIEALEEALHIDNHSPFILTRLAYEYTRKNDLVRGEQMAQMAVGLDPNYRDAHYLLGKVYAARGEWIKGEESLKKVIELDQEAPEEGIIALSVLYVESKQPEKAIETLKAFLEKDASHLLAHYYLGRVYSEMNQLDLALKAYEAAVDINPTFSAAQKAIAFIYEYQGKAKEAIHSFEKVLEAEPDNVDVRNHLGQLYIEQQDYVRALKEFEQVVKLQPNDATARLRIGLIHLRQEEYQKAEKTFSELLKEVPALDQVRYYLGLVFEKQGKVENAVKVLEQVKSSSSVYIDAQLVLGFVYEGHENLGSAESTLRKALKEKPTATSVRAGLAGVLVKQRRYEEAITLLEQGISKSSKDETLWFSLAEVYDKMGNLPKFVECVKTVIEVNPDNANALNYLGYTYAEKRINLAEAEQLIKRALEIKPKDGYITDSLGWVYYQMGMLNDAIKKLEEAMGLAPNEPVIMEHFADALIKHGNSQRAREIYEQAFKLSRDKLEKQRIDDKIKALPKSQDSSSEL